MTNPGITDLLAYWRMEEESGIRYDSHGSYDCTFVYNNPGFGVGKQDNALDLDGINQGLGIGDSPGISMGGDVSFCIGLWFKASNITSNIRLMGKWSDTDVKEYTIAVYDSRINFYVRDGANLVNHYITADNFGDLSDDTWYFVYAYYDADSNTMGVGVNDVFNSGAGPTNGVFDGWGQLWVGRGHTAGYYLEGLIDEMFVYKERLLGTAERTWMYNSGSGRTYDDLLINDLTSVGITADPVLGTPIIDSEGELVAVDITANPVLDKPIFSIYLDLPFSSDLPDPVQLTTDPLLIYVLNGTRSVIDIIEDYYSLIWTERYSDVGDFELELPIEYALDPSIVFGNFLYIGVSDKLMVIEDIKPSFGEEKTNLLIRGRSAESLLGQRVLLNPVNVEGIAEATIYTLVDENIVNPDDSKRSINAFKDTFPSVSTTVEFEEQLEMQNLYNAVKTICKNTNLGFKISLEDDRKLAFSVYEGEDRSYDQSINTYVIFSDDFDNVISSSFYESEKDKINIVLVATEDWVEALQRVFVWESGESEPQWAGRREVILETNIDRIVGVSIAPEPVPVTIAGPDPPDPPEPPEPPSSPPPLSAPTLGVVGQDNLAAIDIQVNPIIQVYSLFNHLVSVGIISTPMVPMPAIGVYGEPSLSDAEVLAIINTRGRVVIEENKLVGLFEGDFDIQGNFEYGVDFFMGDVVQCNLEGRNVKARIIELVRSYSVEGEKSYVAMDFII